MDRAKWLAVVFLALILELDGGISSDAANLVDQDAIALLSIWPQPLIVDAVPCMVVSAL